MEWRDEITPARAAVLTRELEWILQRQNHRFAQAVRDRHLPMRQRQVLAMIVSCIGMVATAALMMTSPQISLLHFAMIAFFWCTFVLALVMPRVQTWSRRFAGRMIRRRAERAIARLPKDASYRVDGLPRAGLVLSTEHVIALFRRTGSLNPMRVLPVPGDAERDAVIAALAGASHERITGAVDGYVEPLPVARVR